MLSLSFSSLYHLCVFILMPLVFFCVSTLPVFHFLFPPFCRLFPLSILLSFSPSAASFPSLSLPRSSSLSHVPWLGSDWHLQITPWWRHCVWPFSLSSPASLPFCHLITVNPRPVPRCWIFNGPACLPAGLSTPQTQTPPLSPPDSPVLSLSCLRSLSLNLCVCVLIQSPISVSLYVIKECVLSALVTITAWLSCPPDKTKTNFH